MDSTGLALLMNAYRREAPRAGLRDRLPGGRSRVFEIADMVESLHVYPDRASARRAATQAGG